MHPVGSVFLSSLSPSPKSSSGYFPEELGTEDMSLGHSTQALQEGTQPTWQQLSGPHLCVMEQWLLIPWCQNPITLLELVLFDFPKTLEEMKGGGELQSFVN